MFSRILIANRGIIRTNCIQAIKELGARAAVMSIPTDKTGLGERTADEVYEITSTDPTTTYYDREAILELAQKIGADAVHPGYGFLAEDAKFAHDLREKGITLIASGLINHDELLTLKTKTKAAASELGIRVIPGSDACNSLEEAKAAAKNIGFPVVVKPVWGSGGIGIKMVLKEQKLKAAYDSAITRAEQLKVSSRAVMVEKFIERARHIEFPVLRDNFGNVVVFPAVECSIQRRFRKFVAESPAPIKDKGLIKQLSTDARRLVEKLSLVGFASVEFLIEDGKTYFNEINGYIQPSHIVTHALTGVDLLKQQIRLIAGGRLSITQQEVNPRGHAISVTINAEDPEENFVPSPGKLESKLMFSGTGLAVHKAIMEGDTISSFYEPVIAEVVATDVNRLETIYKLRVALSGFVMEGLKTNLSFLRAILQNQAFVSGTMDSAYISNPKNFKELLETASIEEEEDVAAILAAMAIHNDSNSQQILLAAAQRSENYSFWNFTSRLFNRNKMEF